MRTFVSAILDGVHSGEKSRYLRGNKIIQIHIYYNDFIYQEMTNKINTIMMKQLVITTVTKHASV